MPTQSTPRSTSSSPHRRMHPMNYSMAADNTNSNSSCLPHHLDYASPHHSIASNRTSSSTFMNPPPLPQPLPPTAVAGHNSHLLQSYTTNSINFPPRFRDVTSSAMDTEHMGLVMPSAALQLSGNHLHHHHPMHHTLITPSSSNAGGGGFVSNTSLFSNYALTQQHQATPQQTLMHISYLPQNWHHPPPSLPPQSSSSSVSTSISSHPHSHPHSLMSSMPPPPPPPDPRNSLMTSSYHFMPSYDVTSTGFVLHPNHPVNANNMFVSLYTTPSSAAPLTISSGLYTPSPTLSVNTIPSNANHHHHHLSTIPTATAALPLLTPSSSSSVNPLSNQHCLLPGVSHHHSHSGMDLHNTRWPPTENESATHTQPSTDSIEHILRAFMDGGFDIERFHSILQERGSPSSAVSMPPLVEHPNATIPNTVPPPPSSSSSHSANTSRRFWRHHHQSSSSTSAGAIGGGGNNNNNNNNVPVLPHHTSASVPLLKATTSSDSHSKMMSTTNDSIVMPIINSYSGHPLLARIGQHKNDPEAIQELINSLNSALLISPEEFISQVQTGELVAAVKDIIVSEVHYEDTKSMCLNVLSHLMDTSLRSSDHIVTLVPHMLHLMHEHCYLGDMFERVIHCIEYISRRHGRHVLLQDDVINQLLPVFDFLTSAQLRTALCLVRNCVAHLSAANLVQYYESRLRDCDHFLINHVLKMSDRECVELSCDILQRQVTLLLHHNNELGLTHSLSIPSSSPTPAAAQPPSHHSSTTTTSNDALLDYNTRTCSLLREMFSEDCLTNLIALLLGPTSPLRSFGPVFRLLSTLCQLCYSISVDLLKLDIPKSLSLVLTGGYCNVLDESAFVARNSAGAISQILSSRKHEEVLEGIHLASELLPPLPTSAAGEEMYLFANNTINPQQQQQVHNNNIGANNIDSAALTLSHMQMLLHHTLALDDDNNIKETEMSDGSGGGGGGGVGGSSCCITGSLSMLYELFVSVYRESGHSDVRQKCISGLLRFYCHVPLPLLGKIHACNAISSALSSMLSESNGNIVVGALHLCRLTLHTMPHNVAVPFKKEGILYKLSQLEEENHSLFKEQRGSSRVNHHLTSASAATSATPTTMTSHVHNNNHNINNSSSSSTTITSNDTCLVTSAADQTRLPTVQRRVRSSHDTTTNHQNIASSGGGGGSTAPPSRRSAIASSVLQHPTRLWQRLRRRSTPIPNQMDSLLHHGHSHAVGPVVDSLEIDLLTAGTEPQRMRTHVESFESISGGGSGGSSSHRNTTSISNNNNTTTRHHSFTRFRNPFSQIKQAISRHSSPPHSSSRTSASSSSTSHNNNRGAVALTVSRDHGGAGGGVGLVPDILLQRIREENYADQERRKEQMKRTRDWIKTQATLLRSHLEEILNVLQLNYNNHNEESQSSGQHRDLLLELQELANDLRAVVYHQQLTPSSPSQPPPSTTTTSNAVVATSPADSILLKLAAILVNCREEITSFEFEQSKIIDALLFFLTSRRGDCCSRLRTFFKIFLHRESSSANIISSSSYSTVTSPPLTAGGGGGGVGGVMENSSSCCILLPSSGSLSHHYYYLNSDSFDLSSSSSPSMMSGKPPLGALVSCLLACLHHQEQFHTRLTPRPMSSTSFHATTTTTSAAAAVAAATQNKSEKINPSSSSAALLYHQTTQNSIPSGVVTSSSSDMLLPSSNNNPLTLTCRLIRRDNPPGAMVSSHIVLFNPFHTVDDIEKILQCIDGPSAKPPYWISRFCDLIVISNASSSSASSSHRYGHSTSCNNNNNNPANVAANAAANAGGGDSSTSDSCSSSASNDNNSDSIDHQHHVNSLAINADRILSHLQHHWAERDHESDGPKWSLYVNNSPPLAGNLSIYEVVTNYRELIINQNRDDADSNGPPLSPESEDAWWSHHVWSMQHVITYETRSSNNILDHYDDNEECSTALAAGAGCGGGSHQRQSSSSSSGVKPSKKRKCNESASAAGSGSNHPPLSIESTSHLPTTQGGVSITKTIKKPQHFSILLDFMRPDLPDADSRRIHGSVAPTLSLLRVLWAINKYWYTLDNQWEQQSVIDETQFHSAKLDVKVNRQLRAYFPVLVNDLPKWLVQLLRHCSFLFPFITRQHFFYLYQSDRARMRDYLQDLGVPEAGHQSSAQLQAFTSSFFNRHPVGVVPDKATKSLHKKSSQFNNSKKSVLSRQILTTTTTATPSSSSTHHLQQQQQHHLHHHGGGGGESSSFSSNESQIPCRRRLTVSRDADLLKQAMQHSIHFSNPRETLEVQFSDEAGFGSGPTQEFYTLLSREFMRNDLDLWHHDTHRTSLSDTPYVVPLAPGLYPKPLPKRCKFSLIKEKFRFLGILLARAVHDQHQLDLPLSPLLFKWLLGQEHMITGSDLIHVDPQLAVQLHYLGQLLYQKQQIETNPRSDETSKLLAISQLGIAELYLTFVLPGYNIDLIHNGRNISVTVENFDNYLNLVVRYLLHDGISRQMLALKEGFQQVLSPSRLLLFEAEELENLFCGHGGGTGLRQQSRRDDNNFTMAGGVGGGGNVGTNGSHIHGGGGGGIRSHTRDYLSDQSDWSIASLMQACHVDHGFTMDSPAVQNLFHIMYEFNSEERRLFLQFVTGSPRLPVGGFRALKPPLTIVMKRNESSSTGGASTSSGAAVNRQDDPLPSVMTCQSFLKLPNYSSREKMKEKLLFAIREGQHAFHLS